MTKGIRLWKQVAQTCFHHRVAGLSLRGRVRSLDIHKKLKVELLLLRIEVEVVWASIMEVSWTPLCGRVFGMSNWEEGPGQTPDTLERLHLSVGLGMPQYSSGGTREGG